MPLNAENNMEEVLFCEGIIMKKLLSLILLMVPVLVFAQTENTGNSSSKITEMVSVPVQAQYSDRFKISSVYFNKKMDLLGRGELLEIELVIENMTDDPVDLNVFTLATYEIKNPDYSSSFVRPKDTGISLDAELLEFKAFNPEASVIRLSAFPDTEENFKYPLLDADGKQKKDYFGKDLFEYRKVPKVLSKAKSFRLEDKMVIRTTHLCRFIKKYHFFNQASVLIYDNEGKPVFVQFYSLDGERH